MTEDYRILDWDSQFFGYKVAFLKPVKLASDRLNEIISDLAGNDISLIYCFINPDDEISNNSMRNISGFLADEKITFFTNIGEEHNFVYSDHIEPYKLNYTSDKLKLLALQSGIYSRFKVDPDFKNDEYRKLYLEWIEKSVKKLISTEILVYYKNNDEKGFVTLDIKEDRGTIGLIAVDELERGNSIGRELMNAALYFFKANKVNSVEVVTQKANIVACRFYKSLGFEVKSIENVYHIWIK
jgi:dTDP-4-amino-4,6-dideoxy-D-galactose acyltransferase